MTDVETDARMYMLAWLKERCACDPGYEWAERHAESLDHLWATAPQGAWVVWLATRPGVLDDRTLRRFGCWCVRQVWGLLIDERSRRAVEVAERHIDGLATDEELCVAYAAAADAADAADAAYAAAADADAAAAAAAAAAADAADAAADDAAYAAAAAAADAAADAAYAAAAAADAAAYAAADAAAAAADAAGGAQAAWLREHTHPTWS